MQGGESTGTIDPDGGDFAVSNLFNPLSSVFDPAPAGTACAVASGAKEPGSVNHETAPATTAYTLMGATTVIAKIGVTGDGSQIAARLVDVSPDGSDKILVSRGLWRPDGSGFQVFQLFANGWKVEPGHILRLELLPRDSEQAEPNGFWSTTAALRMNSSR
ncbi:MAG: CocE/NonD family hydrolase C-terminal non-catalytic domain-containing protein [Solirubrobacterales bacterium]